MDMRLWKTFNIQKREGIAYYNTQSEFETEQFALHLNRLICEEMTATGKDGVMFLCIGTDRSTGDSLGPLIGHKPVSYTHLDVYKRQVWSGGISLTAVRPPGLPLPVWRPSEKLIYW